MANAQQSEIKRLHGIIRDHDRQNEAFRLMYKALGKALDEIHNPGANRVSGMDIVGHIKSVRELAAQVAPE